LPTEKLAAPVCAPPRSRKLNGAVERAQRTHTEEFYEVRPFAAWTIDAINREARAWERVYNTIRPHQALGDQNSASVPPRPARRRPRS
jgi:transposase InsO family protein